MLRLTNPYSSLGNASAVFTWVALLITIAIAFFLTRHGKPLGECKLDGKATSILSLEFAGTLSYTNKLLQSWRDTETKTGKTLIDVARENVIYDFVFIPAYVVAIMLVCGYAAEGRAGWTEQLILLVAWCQILAGVLDVVENVLSLQILASTKVENHLLPRIVWWCAAIKFAIVGTGVAIGLTGCIAKWRGR